MKNYILMVLSIFLLSSCYTIDVANKQVNRAHFKFPELTTGFCVEKFPVKDSIIEKTKIIKGKETVIYKTEEVDCDSVVKNPEIENRVVVKWKYIEKEPDTVVKKVFVYKEDTAKLKLSEIKKDKAESNLAEQEKRTAEQKQGKDIYRGLFLLVAVALGISLFKR